MYIKGRMNKQAEVLKRQQLYFACRAILRTKYGSYEVPRTNRFMQKQAVINPIGIATGALTGGTAGYSGGKWLSDKMGLDENSWGARALRWGGGALGAVAGGTIGNFAGPLAGKLMGWGGKALGAAGKLIGFGGKATKAINAASKATKATNFGSKLLSNAKNLGNKAVNYAKDYVKDTNNWQKGLDYLHDMTSTGYNTDNSNQAPPQQQIYSNPNQGSGGQTYDPTSNLAGTNIPVVSQAPNGNSGAGGGVGLQDMLSAYQQNMQATA